MPCGRENEVIQERSRDVLDGVNKMRLLSCLYKILYFVGTSAVTTISNNQGNILQTLCKTSLKKNEYCCVVQMHGSEHTWCFRWFRSNAVIFQLFKVFSSSLQHIWRNTGQTFVINWSKIQLSWVLMLYYPYKMMFSAYKSVIVSPCACDLFVSKVMKITRTWMSVFGGHFSALFQGVMTVSWNQLQPGCWNYLYYIFIHSCKYTTQHFKWKQFSTHLTYYRANICDQLIENTTIMSVDVILSI